MYKLAIYAGLLFVLILSGCAESKKSDRITIVTTTGILADCVQNIVGDQAEVISLMGAGVDPHLYKASQGDISKLANADIIIYNGLHLEGKMAKMLENYNQQKPTYAIGSYMDPAKLKRVDGSSDLVDPHVWFDPTLWMQGLKGIANELSKVKGLEKTNANYDVYAQQVNASQAKLIAALDSNLVQEKRILITSHDAFSYFGNAFGFTVRGLQGISTAAEYGARDVKDLTDYIITHNIKSVFVETSVSDKNLQAVLDGANARNYQLTIGGTLYSDALGADGTFEGTYIGMIETNVNTIINGLK